MLACRCSSSRFTSMASSWTMSRNSPRTFAFVKFQEEPMGEAKQRRLARLAGKPWDRDKPKPPVREAADLPVIVSPSHASLSIARARPRGIDTAVLIAMIGAINGGRR